MYSTNTNTYYLRWMIRQDMQFVIQMKGAWEEDKYVEALRKRDTIDMVIDDGAGTPVGAIVYQLRKHHLKIIHLVVNQDKYRFGFGSAMLNKLKAKITNINCGLAIFDLMLNKMPWTYNIS